MGRGIKKKPKNSLTRWKAKDIKDVDCHFVALRQFVNTHMHKTCLLRMKSYMETAKLFSHSLIRRAFRFFGIFPVWAVYGRTSFDKDFRIHFFRVSSPWSIRPLTALQRSTSNDENKFQMEKGKWEDKQTNSSRPRWITKRKLYLIERSVV